MVSLMKLCAAFIRLHQLLAFGFYVVRAVKQAFMWHVCAFGWCRCSFCTALTRPWREGRARWWTASTWPSSCREKTQRPSGHSPRSTWTSQTRGRTTATSCCSPRNASSSEWRRSPVVFLFPPTHTLTHTYTYTHTLCVWSKLHAFQKMVHVTSD